ncbi:ATP-binding protein [Streptomyces sp. JW3]|uniref:ATP-binding protein n=1 Tax=Streptomyces sp. JW3 TaxID=3456955 RepID=UPI003FA44283
MTAESLPSTDDGPAVRWRELAAVPPQDTQPRAHAQPRHLPQQSMTWQLSGRSLRCPAQARTAVRAACERWQVVSPVVDDAAVIVSELTSNAVQHAPAAELTLSLRLSTGHVWVSVSDHGPRTRIQPHEAADTDERGRGLAIVEALATRYGVDSSAAGTTVWACLELPARTPQQIEETPDDARAHP